jgi:inosine-uridine nucleoside N-ribohydrolase
MYSKFEPNSPGYPLHDLLAVAYLIDEGAFKTEKLHVTVETQGHVPRGQTVADKRQTSSMVKQINLCVEVDVERVFQTFFDRIAAA